MPCRRGRKRWRKRSVYCMPLPRPCIDSYPRYFMPHCPLYRPCPPQHAPSGSSLSDYSCPDEEYCTAESCRNAPMCITAQPQYCPYACNEHSQDQLHARPPAADAHARAPREMNDTFPQGYPQAASTPYPPCFRQGSCPASPAPPAAQNRTCPASQRPNECPYMQNTSAPCRQQITANYPAAEHQRVVARSGSSAAQSQIQLQPQMPSTQSSFFIPESAVDPNRDQKVAPQHPSYFPPTQESTPSQKFDTFRESSIQESDRSQPQCLNRGKGYCSMKGKCAKELAFQNSATYHSLPEPSSSNITAQFAPDRHSSKAPYKTGGSRRPPNDPSSMYQQSYAAESDRMQQLPEAPIPYIHDAVSTSIRTEQVDGTKCPCPCRYPPAFKHFSCAGNISGSCNCRGHD